MDIAILYEDNHLIIVEKPVNVPVQADASKDMDVLSYVKADIKKRYNKPGNVYLGLIHRLDRPVGGAIVLAKTSKAASRMSNILRKQALDRKYVAVVRGSLHQKQDRLNHYLWKDRRKNKVYVVDKLHPNAKEAILDYKQLATRNNLSFLRVQLKTGRSHQIRVQLNELGHPLYGDQKYGEHVNKHGEQIALWANELTFVHPVKNETIHIVCPPPRTYPWNLWNENEIQDGSS